tara:strand:- start:1150 stop:2325 length:1176 start_codon:yes stop_codon:yes gene_type:complete
MPLIILGTLSLLLCIFGVLEFRSHQVSLNRIPLRIHVNGTRGKSSVTRLIAAGLRQSGLKTFAKTTGTAPRVIDADGKDRIIHRLRLPSIGEQVKLLKYFASKQPDVVVMECMAVQPQYQWIAEHQMVKSHIGVITNARPDHLDEMGPTDVDVVMSLCNTIPINGVLVTGEDEKMNLIRDISIDNGSKFIKSDDSSITKEELEKFKYMEHPSNIAVALDVCKEAGVHRDEALKGMYEVQPDAGALVAWNLNLNEKSFRFINGMAANDPVSTLQIWKFIADKYKSEEFESCIFFNSREDRLSRTNQMIELTLKEIKPDHFIVRGDRVMSIIEKNIHYSPNTKIDLITSNDSINLITNNLGVLPNNTVIYAIGNQVGAGQEILELISTLRENG